MAGIEPGAIIETPSPVSCIDIVDSVVVLGCEDGSVRRYDLPATKVQKALIGEGQSVSWIRFCSVKGKEHYIWLATGMEILQYNFALQHGEELMTGTILRTKDATARISVPPETEDDEINEIALKKDHLVFTTDSGRIGCVELSSNTVTFCRQMHRNIALPIAFVPSRPTEICSGGYDNTLLHFDVRTGTLLSHFDISPPLPQGENTPGISLSPPFALGLAINSDDIVACSTATGHVWLGYGGSKKASSTQGKRKSRKWNGLKSSDGSWLLAGNGPIVAVVFNPANDAQLITLSLHGNISSFEIPDSTAEQPSSQPQWTVPPRKMIKAATLVVSSTGILSCGVTANNRGVLELWDFLSAQGSNPDR